MGDDKKNRKKQFCYYIATVAAIVLSGGFLISNDFNCRRKKPLPSPQQYQSDANIPGLEDVNRPSLANLSLLALEELRTLDALIVNTAADKYIVRKNEEEGIKDIRKLLEGPDISEGWIYMPEQELWIEAGEIQDGPPDFSEPVQLMFDQESLCIAGPMQEDMHFYYFHPSRIYESWVSEARDAVLKLEPSKEFYTDESIKARVEQMPKVKSAIPSARMVSNMVLTSLFSDKVNPGKEVMYCLCSDLGITDFSLTESGREYFKDIDDRLDIFLETERAVDELMALKLVHGFPEVSDVQHCVDFMNSLYKGHVKATFAPYEN